MYLKTLMDFLSNNYSCNDRCLKDPIIFSESTDGCRNLRKAVLVTAAAYGALMNNEAAADQFWEVVF